MDDVFKIPAIPDASQNTEETNNDEDTNETNSRPIVGPALPSSDFTPGVRHKNLQYDEPSTSSLPTAQYFLEVLKSGSIIDNIFLSHRSYTVFGRAPDSDIVLEHPTISRYHALIQYKSASNDGQPAGLYLYDCGSTHGTFLNKKRLEEKVYVRIKVGHILKFGQSTRLYLVQGDAEAEEEATVNNDTGENLTHEQMKEFHEKRAKKLAAVRAKRELIANEANEQRTEMDWGMGPDAEEVEKQIKTNVVQHQRDEEEKQKQLAMDLKNRAEYQKAKNDQAVLKEIMSRVDEPSEEDESSKEPFYLKDPKRALTTFFEREGAELVYDVEDRHFGSYRCTIKLPIIDEYGRSMQAECEDQHCKRKEIIQRCILEACRILDEHGVLREGTAANATTSIRVQQIKRQMLAENDFYEEDEDTFFDRTGELEKKRLKRMERAGVTTQETPVENFDSLTGKLLKLYQEQAELEDKLEKAKLMEEAAAKNAPQTDKDTDELDFYIQQLKQGERTNIKVKVQWKKRLLEIENEERPLFKLLKVCKPREFDIIAWRKNAREEAKNKFVRVNSAGK